MSLPEDPKNKTDLFALIQGARQELEASLARISPELILQSGVIGVWSIKDVLAHITAWERRMILWITQALAGEVPAIPQSWDDVHQLNATSFEADRQSSLAEILDGFQVSYRQALELVRGSPEADLFDLSRYPWRGDRPLWRIIAANTWEHYHEHTLEFLDWLNLPPALFRQVSLVDSIPGVLYLHSMPGRYESFNDFSLEAQRLDIGHVICLAPLTEIQEKSPIYAQAIAAGGLSWQIEMFPIPDYGTPGDRPAFRALGGQAARWLQNGERVLIHCGAGIGRTGTLAISIIIALGEPLELAKSIVLESGSHPETTDQSAVLEWLAAEESTNKISTGENK